MSTFWLVEMGTVNSGGEVDERRVFDTVEKLCTYIRVNAADVRTMRIAIADEDNLVDLRIAEAFEDK